ncbi:sigma-54-dependent transcriptional regulator [Bacteroidota bacterium]
MQKNQGSILIIDDNREFLIAMKLMLSEYFEVVETISRPDKVPELIKNTSFDVIVLDMNFQAGINTGNEGFYWMTQLKESDPDATIVFITAFGDIDLAIESLKKGAADFIQKSWDEKKILSTILSSYNQSLAKKKINDLQIKKSHLHEKEDEGFRVCRTESPAMNRIYDMVKKVAVTDANVLITGESGTGKEVIAREIHRQSSRNKEVFVSVDLGVIPEKLFESELFGHVKGAFTDARDDKPGRIEIANGGTLFLDEIGNLPLNQQPKLLHVLQERCITRVGDHRKRKVDFRLIAATNMDLENMVSQGLFREDLLYRIKTVEISLPSLRERPEDISVLADYFMNEYKIKYNKPKLNLSVAAIKKMQKFPWTGNVRELQHLIEKAVILSESISITPEDMDSSKLPVPVQDDKMANYNIAEHEKTLIRKALEQFNWNMSMTSKELGINRSTLYEKIKKYEL